MKIFCIFLTLILIVLGANHAVLYLDYQTLREQLVQQQANFDTRLQQERETYQQKIDSLQDFIAFGQSNSLAPPTPAPNVNLQALDTTGANKISQFVAMQEENIQRTLDKKYSLLMSRLGLSGFAQTELRSLLEQREKILNASSIGYYASQAEIEQAITQQQQSLAEIDRQIDQLLSSPEDKETYQLLKDSAYEQYQMNNFFDQAQGGSPITNDRREALLIAKLEQKQEFTRHMENAASRIVDAPTEEKSFLVEKTYEALNEQKENFLNSARDKLTTEQFEILREREEKQFDEIWKSLKAGWGVN